MGGYWLEASLFTVACGLTALVFPTPQYEHGINAFQSMCLLGRNVILVALWAMCAKQVLRIGRLPPRKSS